MSTEILDFQVNAWQKKLGMLVKFRFQNFETDAFLTTSLWEFMNVVTKF